MKHNFTSRKIIGSLFFPILICLIFGTSFVIISNPILYIAVCLICFGYDLTVNNVYMGYTIISVMRLMPFRAVSCFSV